MVDLLVSLQYDPAASHKKELSHLLRSFCCVEQISHAACPRSAGTRKLRARLAASSISHHGHERAGAQETERRRSILFHALDVTPGSWFLISKRTKQLDRRKDYLRKFCRNSGGSVRETDMDLDRSFCDRSSVRLRGWLSRACAAEHGHGFNEWNTLWRIEHDD
jgi:hypothetical protein